MYKRKISVMEECFEATLKRNAVKGKEDKSIFDQMNSILGNNKSKYSSVEEKVKEMQQRSGFDKFTQDKSNKKTASENSVPDLLVKHPEIKQPLHNIINESGGLLAVQAVLIRLKGIFEAQIKDVSIWQDPKLTVYIGVENKKAQSLHPTEINNNLGKIDRSIDTNKGDDFLKALMPASGI